VDIRSETCHALGAMRHPCWLIKKSVMVSILIRHPLTCERHSLQWVFWVLRTDVQNPSRTKQYGKSEPQERFRYAGREVHREDTRIESCTICSTSDCSRRLGVWRVRVWWRWRKIWPKRSIGYHARSRRQGVSICINPFWQTNIVSETWYLTFAMTCATKNKTNPYVFPYLHRE